MSCSPQHQLSETLKTITNMNEIWFTKVDLPYGWLGNMAPYPVLHHGFRWLTTEALFQALRFDDEAIRQLIRMEKSPMGAKMKAKKHKDLMVVQPMSAIDVANMRMCLRLKMEQHRVIREWLLATGNAVIYEDVGARHGARHLFWGAKQTQQGVLGTNTLGHLWMALRDELRTSAVS
jgi:predicted NAD-dependent protein-ADP-ribosyltransferase YbiA (DUF1768 family)